VEIQMDPHILEHIRIPRYNPENPVHRRLSELSQEAHRLAAELAQYRDIDLSARQLLEEIIRRLPAEQEDARRKLTDLLAKCERLQELEQEIDHQAAQLWGLSDAELKEVQQSLQELAGEERVTGTEEE
ncbi:MAG: hypothetical protein ACPLRM_08585, partial [Anaerolineae bacterium]